MTYEPLCGLVVVELSSFVASPLAGLLLGQLGADVIRVDPIGGAADIGRWPVATSGTSLYWTGLNKGKRSVTVDLRSPEGREIVLALATLPGDGRGIVVSNAVGRGWFAHEELRARRSDVIDVRLLGHPDGRAAVDYTVNAASGFPLLTGSPTEPGPVNHVLPAWDLAAAGQLALAVLAHERRRRTTGEGDLVTVSLSDVATSVASHLGFLAEAEVLGVDRPRYGNYFYGGFGRDFAASDGRVMVAVVSDRQWRALVASTVGAERMASLADALGGADFDDEGVRFRFREAIAGVLEAWFAARTVSGVVEVLEGAGVLCSAYRTMKEALAQEVSGPGDLLQPIDQPGVGRVHVARSVLRSARDGRSCARPAPELGADSGAVLTDLLGFTDAAVTQLRDSGIIGG